MDADPAELVGPGRGRLRRSTAGSPTGASPATAQLEGRHLDPGVAAHVRPRDHRAEGRRRGSRTSTSPQPRAPGSSDGRRRPVAVERSLYQMEDYIQQVLAFDVRAGRAACGSRRWSRSSPRATARSPSRSPHAGKHVARYPDFAEALAAPRVAPGTSCGSVCDVQLPRRAARAAAPAAAHLARPPGLLAAHRPTTTPACPPAASTARRTAATCSGTSCTSIRSSTSGCPRSPAAC